MATEKNVVGIKFGVSGGGSISGDSGARILRQLTEIVDQINKEPPRFKIKLGVDQRKCKSLKLLSMRSCNLLYFSLDLRYNLSAPIRQKPCRPTKFSLILTFRSGRIQGGSGRRNYTYFAKKPDTLKKQQKHGMNRGFCAIICVFKEGLKIESTLVPRTHGKGNAHDRGAVAAGGRRGFCAGRARADFFAQSDGGRADRRQARAVCLQ